MTTEVTDNRPRRRYEITDDAEQVGFLTYRLGDGQIELIHTQIDAEHGGRGLAAILVQGALDDARARGMAVLPRCSYVARFIDEHRDEYLDLVPEDRRDQYRLAG